MSDVKVRFVRRANGPERAICEAELMFAGGPLDGMKLVGLTLWKGADGEIYCTFPSRAFGAGSERRYFDYLRSEGGDSATAKRVKAWVVEEWRIFDEATR